MRPVRMSIVGFFAVCAACAGPSQGGHVEPPPVGAPAAASALAPPVAAPAAALAPAPLPPVAAPAAASATVPPPAEAGAQAVVRADSATGAKARDLKPGAFTTKTLPAPPGWVELKPLRTTAFTKPTTYFRVGDEKPATCLPFRYDGRRLTSRKPATLPLFAEGDDIYRPPFTLVAKYEVRKGRDHVFEVVPLTFDYFDTKGRRYEGGGEGIGLCGNPRYTVVAESATGFEVLEAEPPFAAYNPEAVEIWFKDEASCKASMRPPPLQGGCR